ncbi:hypothetical protein KC968_04690 [Candidatus Saccharibacteria bacterium]|nr:hypothetical protein [Candidatus Saccharibacteria bacterium]
MVLASTNRKFEPQDFETNKLYSHIARREVIITRQEFKGHNEDFYLAHAAKQTE